MADLRCRTIIPAIKLVSQQVSCLGTTEYGEKGQQIFHAVTWWPWPSISCHAEQAAAQSNHQYQWEDQFHTIEQEKTGVAWAEINNPYSNQEHGPFVFCWIIYLH